MRTRAEAGRRWEALIGGEVTATFEETGEFRCPEKDEWFLGGDGSPVLAKMSFIARRFPILKLVLE